MAEGTLSTRRFRAALRYFYRTVELFPKFMASTLTRVPEGDVRRNNLACDWLIRNIAVERKHARWYRQWAMDFGVDKRHFVQRDDTPAETDGLNNYLWHVSAHGTLAEALAAVNFGIEYPVGQWVKRVQENIQSYGNRKGVKIHENTLKWLTAHAHYDDTHPYEVLDLITLFARTKADRNNVTRAAQRSMEYCSLAVETIYNMEK